MNTHGAWFLVQRHRASLGTERINLVQSSSDGQRAIKTLFHLLANCTVLCNTLTRLALPLSLLTQKHYVIHCSSTKNHNPAPDVSAAKIAFAAGGARGRGASTFGSSACSSARSEIKSHNLAIISL